MGKHNLNNPKILKVNYKKTESNKRKSNINCFLFIILQIICIPYIITSNVLLFTRHQKRSPIQRTSLQITTKGPSKYRDVFTSQGKVGKSNSRKDICLLHEVSFFHDIGSLGVFDYQSFSTNRISCDHDDSVEVKIRLSIFILDEKSFSYSIWLLIHCLRDFRQ